MPFPLVYVFMTNACIFWSCSLKIYFMTFWNWCFTWTLAQYARKIPCLKWHDLCILGLRSRGSLKIVSQEKLSFNHFDKTNYWLCLWLVPRAMYSRLPKSRTSRKISRKRFELLGVQVIRGWEQRTDNKKKTVFTIFLLSCYYSYSVYFDQI